MGVHQALRLQRSRSNWIDHTIISECTLREIYLPPFEAAVKEGHTATVMGAYNSCKSARCPLPNAMKAHFF